MLSLSAFTTLVASTLASSIGEKNQGTVSNVVETANGIPQIIDKIANLAIIICLCLVVGGLIVVFGILYSRKKKRIAKVAEESIDYSDLTRKDAIQFSKFDDIKDDMMIVDHGTRFIGYIKCVGFDFYSAPVAERLSAQSGYRAFIGMIDEPISYRQYTQTVDLEDTALQYKGAYDKMEEELFNLNEDRKSILNSLESMEHQLGKEQASQSEDFIRMVNYAEDLQRKITNKEWRLHHIEDQLVYIEQLSGKKVTPTRNETYVFDWIYDPYKYPRELSEEEIYAQAIQNLYSKGRAMISALSSAGVKARRCTTKEIIEMERRHNKPLSSDIYKMKDVENSSFYEDIISTLEKDSLNKEYDEAFMTDLAISVTDAINKTNMDLLNNLTELNSGINETEVEEEKNYISDKPHTDVSSLSFEVKEDTGEEQTAPSLLKGNEITEEEEKTDKPQHFYKKKKFGKRNKTEEEKPEMKESNMEGKKASDKPGKEAGVDLNALLGSGKQNNAEGGEK